MKAELVQKLERNRDDLLSLLEGLTEEQITTIPVVGSWTIKDAVGHIAYWEGVILDHVRESLSQGLPRPQREDEDDDTVNPREAAKRKGRPWARVRMEFVNVRAALIGKVNGLNELDLAFQVPNPWLNQSGFFSVGQMIEEDAIGHCREHAEQIRRWKSEIGS